MLGARPGHEALLDSTSSSEHFGIYSTQNCIYDLMHPVSSCCTGHRGMQVQVLQQVSNIETRQSPAENGINTVNGLGP